MGLQRLEDYKKPPLESFWSSWPKRTFEQALPSKSWVNNKQLRELAMKYRYSYWARLEQVCHRLDYGANTGCIGRARLPTIGTNAISAYTFGDRVCDHWQR